MLTMVSVVDVEGSKGRSCDWLFIMNLNHFGSRDGDEMKCQIPAEPC